ncbi:adenylate kinase [Nostoc sp. FACHB-152]|uniref:EutP/PduV family microcompartment system protein n=1 Tax=unclassified Nostoc TaxID=2593658 RepID=UPI00168889EA|nr:MULTISPECIES: EutP/PduV family microcompartment system protein [unclassified Nostoc]MBD2447143.1 adenylate kinase [Nostoc sp. FACHB-152]MBD2469179.1 adenylate kinase [Nostoc sp. FACHB-145]
MQRISVVGTTGSGKTTLARQISQRLAIPHVELDYLHWEPNWVEVPNDVMRDRVAQSLCGDRWVVDGNYSIVQDIIWARADTVVWLDYSWPVVMSRILRRTFSRVVTQQQVCNGNYETWQKSFMSRDSILLWAIQTYGKNRQKYQALFQASKYHHLNFVHLRSPAAAKNWLSSIE